MQRTILQDLSYGVYVIGSKDENRNVGCIANSVMQITANPTTVAISIHHDNYTNTCIQKSNQFSISVLHQESNPEIIKIFGFSSSREKNKFETIEYEEIDGLPVLKDTNGYIICEVVGTLETETHTIFLGKVISSKKTQEKKAMTYQFYQETLKGKSPKNAPTYLPNVEEEIKENRWQCSICGYIYEGAELPLDFQCPLCGQPREAFVKMG